MKIIWKDRKRWYFGLPFSFTRYKLTEDRLITSIGFLSLTEDDLDLYKVNDMSLKLPFSQRIFNCGTIILNVKDVDTPIKEIKCIKNPREVYENIRTLVNDQKKLYLVKGRDMIGSNLETETIEHNDDIEN